jgi:1-aminocyclopropane-1-carboxylate deaminase/D-cysteine desulfhydrase-like pyridoxal-dependent ACC family enzyme
MLPPIEPEFLTNLPGGRQIFIQRLDKIAGPLSGNKWFKLKYNLEQAQQLKCKGLLTFGGAYSNHIYATAAAGYQISMPTVGLIRGEIIEPLNPTLRQARKWGMHLEAMSRSDYRQKNSTEFVTALSQKYPGYYLIPEGGSNTLAVKGCGEILVPGYHYWCVS